MKRAISLPRPETRFPDAGWRDRLLGVVAAAERGGLVLECQLAPGASDEALARIEAAAGRLPPDLRALLRDACGGRLGHLDLLGATEIGPETAHLRAAWSGRDGRPALPGVASEGLFAFARDIAGSFYAARVSPEHGVVFLCEEPLGWEHRFTTLGRFLDAALVRAHAAALHRKAEADEGQDLDDAPWTDAARAVEVAIDPAILRTRED